MITNSDLNAAHYEIMELYSAERGDNHFYNNLTDIFTRLKIELTKDVDTKGVNTAVNSNDVNPQVNPQDLINVPTPPPLRDRLYL